MTRLSSCRRGVAVCLAWAALIALAPAGVAQADCTGAGDFGAASGCAPPGGGSDSGDSWPPTSVDWPPNADVDDSSGSGGGSGGHDAAKPTPIVVPFGQPAPSAPATPESTSPPIVPVESPPGG
ncbi:MAG: hypothetical protein ABWY93_05220 [Mycobacterium sp.]